MLRQFMLTNFFALFVLSASLQVGKSTGSLAGTVFCTDTGTPCRFALIALIPAQPSKTGVRMEEVEQGGLNSATDINGHFVLNGLTPGDYFVSARLPGYFSKVALAHGQVSNRDPASDPATDSLQRVSILPTKTSTVHISLVRAGSISGIATYDDGGTAIDLPVQVLKRNGKGEWKLFQTNDGNGARAFLDGLTSTDDRGHYRFASLPPGTYTVRATLPNVKDLASGLLNTTGRDLGSLSIYVGGQYAANDKSAIELKEGDELEGENLDIPTQNLWEISGVAKTDDTEAHTSRAFISLLDSSGHNVLRSVEVGILGDFIFSNIVTGMYRLSLDRSCATAKQQFTIGINPLSIPLSVQSDLTDLVVECSSTQP